VELMELEDETEAENAKATVNCCCTEVPPDPTLSFREVDPDENLETDSSEESFDQQDHFFDLASRQYQQMLTQNPNDRRLQQKYDDFLKSNGVQLPNKKFKKSSTPTGENS